MTSCRLILTTILTAASLAAYAGTLTMADVEKACAGLTLHDRPSSPFCTAVELNWSLLVAMAAGEALAACPQGGLGPEACREANARLDQLLDAPAGTNLRSWTTHHCSPVLLGQPWCTGVIGER